MKLPATIAISKAAFRLNRLTGSGGTALPGLVAKRLHSGILADLAKGNFPRGIIVITGTNGKTTTAKMVSDVLTKAGISHIHNRAGSNLERGIIASLLENSDSRGRCDVDMAVFEVDEAFVPVVCRQLKPKYLAVTNLFRDQLDRYGELDSIAKSFSKILDELDCQIILNADDPLVASLGSGVKDKKKVVYFGISDYKGPKINNDYAQDSVFDPKTGDLLEYSQRFFGHIGIYSSKDGKFRRPDPNVNLTKMIRNDQKGSTFDVKIATQSQELTLQLPGVYNVYNALAAISVCDACGVSLDATKDSLEATTAAFGRMENLTYEQRGFLLLLIKNPTGFNQIIQTYLKGDVKASLWLIINDNFADGRDVSWLWDAALEDISGYKGQVTVSGVRAYDMALRLKYANIDNLAIEPNIQKALSLLIGKTKQDEQIYVLPTYTAMLELRKRLVKHSDSKDFWQ